MWPTFLTAYHFPMKMESLYDALVHSEQQPAQSRVHTRMSTVMLRSSVYCMLPYVSAKTAIFHVVYLKGSSFTAVSAVLSCSAGS